MFARLACPAALLAALLLPGATHAGCGYVSTYTGYCATASYGGLSYCYEGAGWYAGRWYPAGYYAYVGGVVYQQGVGAVYGYAGPSAYYGHSVAYAAPYAVPVAVGHDYYQASVRDYYRDSLLSDSIAYKVLTGKQAADYPQGQLPGYGAADPTRAAARAAPGPATPPAAAPPTQPPPAPPARPGAAQEAPRTMPPAVGQGSLPIRTGVSANLASYLKASCVRCHGPSKAEKGLRLDEPATVVASLRSYCYGKCSAQEMPKGGPEASMEQLEELYRWAEAGWAAEAQARARVARGPQVRRLRRTLSPEPDALAGRRAAPPADDGNGEH